MCVSWCTELCAVYDCNIDREFDSTEPPLAPISHVTKAVPIEVVITSDGEFVSANAVSDKDNKVIVIPAISDAAGRTSTKAVPFSYVDKLQYVAGDYSTYTDTSDKYYNAYAEQLKAWNDSKHTHLYVSAWYKYIAKRCLISDLIKANVLHITDDSNKADVVKAAKDLMVRVVIQKDGQLHNTWLDKEFQQLFVKYSYTLLNESDRGMCYLTGATDYITYNHAKTLSNIAGNAKLISANDDAGFTYRGRFANKEESVAVGYTASQKFHNALKWLIAKQGMSIDKTTLVAWTSACTESDKLLSHVIDEEFSDDFASDTYDTLPQCRAQLKKSIFGEQALSNTDSKFMIMGLSATTANTGRMSVTLYAELSQTLFLNNVNRWHNTTAWTYYDAADKCTKCRSVSVYSVIKYAYGTVREGKLSCDDILFASHLLQLIPCVTQNRKIPEAVVMQLYRKASTPLSYPEMLFTRLLRITCGIYRRWLLDTGKDDILMVYDPTITDRSYLFGCLLAIADYAESFTYSQEERYGNRVTNAKRLWNLYVQNPYMTWEKLYKQLMPYFNKMRGMHVILQKCIDEIMSKMSIEDYTSTDRLEPMYLLGYSHYRTYLYVHRKTNLDNDPVETEEE